MIQELINRIQQLEQQVQDSSMNAREIVRQQLDEFNRMDMQSPSVPHLISALCVNTIDPMGENRVQYFTPAFMTKETQIEQLPWAYPISAMGGFDDSGLNWIPPAGSKIAILFENGDKNQAYYIGTFYPKSRGKANSTNPDENRNDLWQYAIPEYDCLWEGTRDGYNLGDNDGAQVKPPWNTENYNTKDWDTRKDFDSNPISKKLITNPHLYGFKTPEKHYLKMVDGDHRCNHKWRRVELASGRGGIFMIKDDHLHPAGQWAYNGGDFQSATVCNSTDATKDCYKGGEVESTQCNAERDTSTPSNPFYKRKEEQRFYSAPESLKQYQNPKCELNQSGIQIQSISGMQFVMDDSVDQPEGEPRWNLDFTFGCNDVFKGKTFIRTTTGHTIEANDQEEETWLRGKDNGIKLETAYGNRIKLSDHTVGSSRNPSEAGSDRGIVIESTSKHILEFHDEGNKQIGEPRKQGGIPNNKADRAFVRLRSGYGLQLMFRDSTDQQKTVNQAIELLAPQTDNTERGPHQLIMQETAEGPGMVLLRSGGNIVVNSYDSYQEVIGTDENPSNKSVRVTGKFVTNTDDYYFNQNRLTIFKAKEHIFLLAGEDCTMGEEDDSEELKKGPCTYPVLVGKDEFVCPFTQFTHYGKMSDPKDPTGKTLTHNSLSDRVFASASPTKKDGE